MQDPADHLAADPQHFSDVLHRQPVPVWSPSPLGSLGCPFLTGTRLYHLGTQLGKEEAIRAAWRHLLGKRRERPPVYIGSHEHKLSEIRPMHFDPDDERPTREDKEAERAERRRGATGGASASAPF